MRVRQMEVFHAVYISGSITGGSRALHVSQPSVSKILQHTEAQLGFALFRRLKGRLVPTEEAHLLFREVDDVYQRVGSLKVTVKNLRTAGVGRLRLAGLPALGLGPMGLLLAAEMDRLDVEMNEVVSVRTFYVAAALVRHGVGLAVVDEFTARATLTPDLHYCRLSPPITFGVYSIWLEERPPSR